VYRTWWFAEFLGRKREMKYDRELLYIASLLHDLGLSPSHAADKRFEVDGADAASRFLLANDYPKSKAEIVWDAIALLFTPAFYTFIRDLGRDAGRWHAAIKKA
jgi:HD superfamily phosphodiesterase